MRAKAMMTHAESRHGQFCLFLNKCYDPRSQFENKQAQWDPVYIHRHFAHLVSQQEPTLLDATLTIVDGSSPPHVPNIFESPLGATVKWIPMGFFSPISKDLLLYLSMMGLSGRSALFDVSGRQQSFAASFTECKKNTVGGVPVKNIDQNTNSGLQLEALLAGAVCVASHDQGYSGLSVKDFLAQLLFELTSSHCNSTETSPSADGFDSFDSLFPFLVDISVPFLAPPNCEWPAFLNQLQSRNVHFGSFGRTVNSEKIDLKGDLFSSDGSTRCFSGECKDRDALKTGDIRDILNRIPAESLLHIVAVQTIENQYFQQAKFNTVEKAIRDRCVYRLLTTTGFEEISGLVDASSPTCAVIFIKYQL